MQLPQNDKGKNYRGHETGETKISQETRRYLTEPNLLKQLREMKSARTNTERIDYTKLC